MKLRLAIVTAGAVLTAGALPASAGVIAFHFGGGEMVLAPNNDFGGGGWGRFEPLAGYSSRGRAWLADIAAGLGVGGWHGGDSFAQWMARVEGTGPGGVRSASTAGGAGGAGGGGGSYTSQRGGSGGGAAGAGAGGSGGGSGYGYHASGGSRGEHGFQFAPLDPSRSWTQSPWVNRPSWSGGWHDGWDGHIHDDDCDDDDGSGGAAVPEPATLLLLGSGLAGLGLSRRRRA